MLTKGDDYPLHQTPDPIALAGTDRNFYDRYFFNGYAADGSVFFAVALGVYPNLNIMDAAFGVRIAGRQYNLHASRHLGMERMDTEVGPVRVEVLEPLRRLRVVVDDPAHGISADLVFEGRHAPIEEPRMARRQGPRLVLDLTRLTQLGAYEGWIRAGGREVRAADVGLRGTRDRSWGVRQVGLRDPQPLVPAAEPQFHWYWVPAQLEDRVLHAYRNEDAAGEVWNEGFVMVLDDGRVEHLGGTRIETVPQGGTRWPRRGTLTARDAAGGIWRVEVEAGERFYLSGIGYMNPDWGHGYNKGPLAVGYDEIETGAVTRHAPPHLHQQSFARLAMTTPQGRVIRGDGVFETLSLGPNAARGLAGLYDAPDPGPAA